MTSPSYDESAIVRFLQLVELEGPTFYQLETGFDQPRAAPLRFASVGSMHHCRPFQSATTATHAPILFSGKPFPNSGPTHSFISIADVFRSVFLRRHYRSAIRDFAEFMSGIRRNLIPTNDNSAANRNSKNPFKPNAAGVSVSARRAGPESAFVEFVPAAAAPSWARQQAMWPIREIDDLLRRIGRDIRVDRLSVMSVPVATNNPSLWSQFELLEVFDAFQSTVDDMSFSKIAALPHLKSIRVSQCPVTSNALRNVPLDNNIESIDLSGSMVDSTCLRYIAKWSAIRAIDVSYTKATLTDEKQLGNIVPAQLSGLGISGCDIDASALLASGLFPQLKRLSARYTITGNDIADALCAVEQLEYLEVTGCCVDVDIIHSVLHSRSCLVKTW